MNAENPHGYEECSGAGLCDRASGQCQCFAGFSGYACQRREFAGGQECPEHARSAGRHQLPQAPQASALTSICSIRTHALTRPPPPSLRPPLPSLSPPGACPSDCSGNGMCRLLSEIPTTVPYTDWDSSQIQACVCDAGYFATDCTQRSCPTGDDPLTLCDSANTGMVQEIRVTLGSGLDYDPTTATGASTLSGVEGMDLFGTTANINFNALQELPTSAQLHVGATDINGQVYYAPASAKGVFAKDDYTRVGMTGISMYDPGVDSMEIALENIPMFKVRNVKVAARFTSPSNGNGISNIMEKRFVVTFIPDSLNSANFGLQKDFVCDSGYGCGNAGCQPITLMPFLYRYSSTATEQSSLDTWPVLPSPAALNFYTGVNNDDANFQARVFLRLAEGSMPRMPPGITVDTGATFSDLARYDVRVAVAVQDPHDPTDSNSPVDVYWTKTTYTNTNITTDTTEYYQNPAAQTAGVFSAAKSADFVGTLNGYTYRGFIPNELTASVPDAPGVIVSFGGTDVVYTDSFYKFFEILIKLPACTVTPITTAGYIDVSGNEVMPISPDVENVECANRGQCNRATGECQCFQGYFGIACHRQTVLA